MRLRAIALALALLAPAAFATWRLAAPTGAAAPVAAPEAPATPAPSPAAPRDAEEAPLSAVPTDEEALAARFQQQVLHELERNGSDAEVVVTRTVRSARTSVGRVSQRAPAQPPATRRLAGSLGAARSAARNVESAARARDVDWAYVDDVFTGRVSGIPNERRAGLSLEELDALGPIPYVEELRAEGRTEELEALGLPQWPDVLPCQRFGPCRRDQRLCGPAYIRPRCTI